ncbi:MAG: flagellar motor protein MotA [Alphaproteobacteria bacterium]|nr:flagellar motor protein MotA [Alphaproteobacteria bacterium]
MEVQRVTQPSRFLTRMGIFLGVVAVTIALLFPALRSAFVANTFLNGVIIGVLLIGIIHAFRTVTMLRGEIAWIESFRRETMVVTSAATPRLLSPMATMLGESSDRISLSTLAMRTLLDGIAARLDESREISRYMIGLLVFLGLLGTFWGLLETVQAVGSVVGGLEIAGNDLNAAFSDLKRGLQAPISGMGTAFSSSLFGLAGSLVLGFLELQAGQAQNRFYNELEEWLSSLTRLSSGAIGVEGGDQSVPAYIQALLEQTADGLEGMQRALARSEENRTDYSRNIFDLTEKIGTLSTQMANEQTLMLKLAESQSELPPILAKLAESDTRSASDEATQAYLRNIETYLSRIHDGLSVGRTDTVQEIRNEIRLLARTIAALAKEPEQ